MKQASTDWQERIAPDEEAHLARVAEVIGKLQRAKSRKFGAGRALHRKQLVAATGTLEVLEGLPDPARHGLFAMPGRHRVLVRLSNGGPDVQANKLPDIRGFALKVLDVSGEAALGGTTDHQDFLMINQDHFSSPDSRSSSISSRQRLQGHCLASFISSLPMALSGVSPACAPCSQHWARSSTASRPNASTPWCRYNAAPMPSAPA